MGARLNTLAKRLESYGLSLYYHNHDFEIRPLENGETGIEILMRETDASLVRFEVDTYWVEKGGLDAWKFIQAHSARIGMIHAKELRRSDMVDVADVADVAAGSGNIEFTKIVPLAQEYGWPIVVEFEGEDAMESVKQSAAYLCELL